MTSSLAPSAALQSAVLTPNLFWRSRRHMATPDGSGMPDLALGAKDAPSAVYEKLFPDDEEIEVHGFSFF